MEEEVKFDVTCYIKGYGVWKLKIYDGKMDITEYGYYAFTVNCGDQEGMEIVNKVFRFPIETTVVVESI